MTADDATEADRASGQRALTGAELTWIAASVAGVLARQPAATSHAGFDNPPDGWPAVLRAP